jgi:hypothetical protein
MALTESEELELLELEAEAKAASDAPGYIEQLGAKASAMVEGIKDTASRLPAGVGKLIEPVPAGESAGRWAKYLMSLGLEGLPVAPTITGEIIPAVAGAGSAIAAGVRGKDYQQAYSDTSDRMRQQRQQVLEGIDPDIRAAANVTGMVIPAKGAAIAADIGAPIATKAARGADFADIASDVTLAGATVGAIPTAAKAAKGAAALVGSAGEGVLKLPARMQGIKSSSITEYLNDPSAVKAASRSATEGRITSGMEDILKASDDAQARIDDLQSQLREAELTQSKDASTIQRDLDVAMSEKSALDTMFKQAQEAELRPLKEQKFSVDEKLRDEKAARSLEVEEAAKTTRESLKGAVEGIQEAAVANQSKLSEAAAKLDTLLSETGTLIPTVGIKKQLMSDMKTLGVPQVGVPKTTKIPGEVTAGSKEMDIDYSPTTYAFKDPRVNTILEQVMMLPAEVSATELVNLKRIVGEAAYQAGAGSGKLDATYRAMNNAVTEVAGKRFPELNSEITAGLKVKVPLESLGAKAESALPKIDRRGGLGVESTLSKLGDNIPSDVIQQYLAARQAEEALKKSSLPSSQRQSELRRSIFDTTAKQKSEVRPETTADVTVKERTAEQKMLNEYLNSIREQNANQQSMAQSNLNAAQSTIQRLGIPTTKETTALPKWVRESVLGGDLEGPTSKVPDVARSIGTTPEKLASEIRSVSAREDIYGREPRVPLESALGIHPISAVRSALRSAGASVATAPLDALRIVKKAANTKWSSVVDRAAKDGKLPMTHYLLQQMDPEYAKAMASEEE